MAKCLYCYTSTEVLDHLEVAHNECVKEFNRRADNKLCLCCGDFVDDIYTCIRLTHPGCVTNIGYPHQ